MFNSSYSGFFLLLCIFFLVHHTDLVNESIECMKLTTWTLDEKEVALQTALELVKIPPHVSQATRCALLRACFMVLAPADKQ